jgi:hypothetical protein
MMPPLELETTMDDETNAVSMVPFFVAVGTMAG